MDYDDVIVGGGSAGAVLAARLSEEPARRVLLVEAGPDYATVEATPADMQDGWRMSLLAHDWGLTAQAVPGRAIPYPRGRVIGGSSAVNAAIALRGVPADYDEWAALGNDEWSWAKVLPHFRRLEDDPEGTDEVHGRGGPIPITRWRPDELIPVQRAFLAAAGPGRGSCGRSYHTDRPPASWQATVKCPQMASSGCSVWAPGHRQRFQVTSARPGRPHLCPFPHRSG
jgi:choline dehydrogenase